VVWSWPTHVVLVSVRLPFYPWYMYRLQFIQQVIAKSFSLHFQVSLQRIQANFSQVNGKDFQATQEDID
jgi:hypothetical protein